MINLYSSSTQKDGFNNKSNVLEKNKPKMDFLTAFPYWGIMLVIIVNAIIVSRMDIRIDEPQDKRDE